MRRFAFWAQRKGTKIMKWLESLRKKLAANRERYTALESEIEENKDGVPTEEQMTEVTNLTAEHKALREQIANAEAAEAEHQLSAQPATRKTSANTEMAGGTPKIEVTERIETDPMRGYMDVAEFANDVFRACKQGMSPSKKLVQSQIGAPNVEAAPTNFHQEGSANDGYMVPPQIRQDLYEVVLEEDSIFNQITREPTQGNSVQLLADESTPWGTTGVSAAWAAEGSQMTQSRLDTEGRDMRLQQLHAYVLASDELLSDAPRLAQRLTTQAGKALNWKLCESIVKGTGAGQPLGYRNGNYSGGVVVAKEGSQAAATVNANNVAKMFARQLNIAGAIWRINQDVLPQLMTMTLDNNLMWTPPASGFTNAPGGFLLGRPIQFSQHCETLGTAGDIEFIDPKGYYGIEKPGGVKFASSMHLFFDYNITAFRWTFRFNGQPFLQNAVSPNNGSNSLSHFVTLATRA